MKTSKKFTIFGIAVTCGGFFLTMSDHAFVGFWSVLTGCLITCMGFITGETDDV